MSTAVHFDSETKTWSGPSVPYTFGNSGVGELIFDNLKNNLSHVAQVSFFTSSTSIKWYFSKDFYLQKIQNRLAMIQESFTQTNECCMSP